MLKKCYSSMATKPGLGVHQMLLAIARKWCARTTEVAEVTWTVSNASVIGILVEHSARTVRSQNAHYLFTIHGNCTVKAMLGFVAEREITVVTHTESGTHSETDNPMYLTLIGSNGETCDEFLLEGDNILQRGQ